MINIIVLDNETYNNYLNDLGEENADYIVYNKVSRDVANTTNSSKTSTTKNSAWSDIVNIAKNMDVNKVQEGILSLQKALGLVSDLFVKDNKPKSEYTPRPLYKHFED